MKSLSQNQKQKLMKIISYVVSVNIPSFITIHLKLTAPQGPFLTLFQRDFISVYREINLEVADVVSKYDVEHATR